MPISSWVGPWLRDFKRAIIDGLPDDHMIDIPGSEQLAGHAVPLGALRSVATITPGQKIGYVTDAADTSANRHAIIDLVRGADLLFIEAAFAAADVALASERAPSHDQGGGRDCARRRSAPDGALPFLAAL